MLSAVAGAMADSRSVEAALREAETFLGTEAAAKGLSASGGQELHLCYTLQKPALTEAAAYMFQVGSDGGYVLVSAEDNTRTILAYSTEGAFDANDIPENMQTWLQHYAEQIAYAASLHKTASTITVADAPVDITDATGNLAVDEAGMAKAGIPRTARSISPLLGNIAWNQASPFWNQCPLDSDNRRCYTGCVATATAQVMRYWRTPVQGSGSHSYEWTRKNGTTRTLSANFSESYYDWDNMLGKYTGSYTNNQANAVAKLMSDIGIASDMSYGSDASGTQSEKAAQAMYMYFGYDAAMESIWADYLGNQEFAQQMYNELSNNRPVLLGGSTTKNEGHAFVCDGYDGQQFFHINWGWSGSQNGYFALTALDPEEQGAGGAASGEGFSVNVSAIIGIQPDKGGHARPAVLGTKGIYVASNTTTTRSATTKISMNQLQNIGLMDWSDGYLGIGVFDANDNFIDWFDGFTVGGGVPVGSYIPNAIDLTSNLKSFGNGSYKLKPIMMDKDAQTVTLLSVAYGQQREIAFTINGETVQFQNTPGGGDQNSYAITNLTATAEGSTVRFSFESEAPYFEVKLYNSTETLASGIVDYKNVKVTDVPDGRWTISVRPVDANQQNYLGAAVTTTVVVNTSGKDYSVQNLTARAEGSTVYFDFEGEAPYYHVKIYNENEERASAIIDFKNVKVDNMPDGVWTIWVRPMDADKKTYLAEATTTTVRVNTSGVDYSIKNLTAHAEGNVVYFDFESLAPYFHVKVYNNDGERASGIVDFKNVKVDNMPDGMWTIWVRPMDVDKKYYLDEAATTTVVVGHDGIRNVATEGDEPRKYLKDGNVYIQRNDRIYNTSGQRLK